MPALDDRGRRATWLIVGGLVVTLLLPFVAQPALRSALFEARAEDLTIQTDVGCDGAPGTPIHAIVSWSWGRGAPFAPPTDGVVVRWSGATAAGESDEALSVLDTSVSDERSIFMGGSSETDPGLGSFRDSQWVEFRINRSGSELADGSVELDLQPRDASSQGGSVTFDAAYAHGDRWVQTSGMATCSW